MSKASGKGPGEEGRWRSQVVHVDSEVDAELRYFGVSREELEVVADGAVWGRNSGTRWDPPGYAGWNQYGVSTRFLRKALIEDRPPQHQWRMDNTGGLCKTVDPTKRIAIVISSGSPETGDPDKNPKTLNPKGVYSRQGLRVNRSQMDLFEGDDQMWPRRPRTWLWFLLIHVDRDTAYAELSLPVDMDEAGRVDHWLKRIIVKPNPPLDEGIPPKDILDDDLDIDVQPRAG